MAHTVPVATRVILEIAAKTETDPRSVRRQIEFRSGKRERGVRGRSGERIDAELVRRGLLESKAA